MVNICSEYEESDDTLLPIINKKKIQINPMGLLLKFQEFESQCKLSNFTLNLMFPKSISYEILALGINLKYEFTIVIVHFTSTHFFKETQ